MEIINIPHSIEAEQVVLGGLLLDNTTMPRIFKTLSANDFYTSKHQLLFDEMCKHNEIVGITDLLMLSDHLKSIDQLNAVGGEAYLFEMAKNTPSAANIDAYADTVKQRAKQRELLRFADELKASIVSGERLPVIVKNATQSLHKIDSSLIDANKLTVLSIAEFLQAELPQMELILDPWLPKQGLAMIYAPRGIGKTHVALNVGYAVASGGSFLNWKAEKPRGVLYIDGEMSSSAMQERLAGIVKSSEKQAIAPFKLITPDMQNRAMPDLSTVEGQQLIEAYLQDIDLIIVDNISTLCRSSKENDAQDWLPIQSWALRMRASGRSVLFIHHAAKNGNQRGTSKREDILDSVISLQHILNYDPEQGAVFEVHFEKSRGFFGEAAQAFQAQLTTKEGSQTWEVKKLEKTNYQKVIELLQEGMRQGDIVKELGIQKSTVSRYAKRAEQEGLTQVA